MKEIIKITHFIWFILTMIVCTIVLCNIHLLFNYNDLSFSMSICLFWLELFIGFTTLSIFLLIANVFRSIDDSNI